MKPYQMALVILLMDKRIRAAATCLVVCLALIPFAAKSYLTGQLGLALFFALVGQFLAVFGGLTLWSARDILAEPGGAKA